MVISGYNLLLNLNWNSAHNAERSWGGQGQDATATIKEPRRQLLEFHPAEAASGSANHIQSANQTTKARATGNTVQPTKTGR